MLTKSNHSPYEYRQLKEDDDEKKMKNRTIRSFYAITITILAILIILAFRHLLAGSTSSFDPLSEAFEVFKKEYGKIYATEKEELYRFEIFRRNVELWEQAKQNAEGEIDFGVTQFADHTNEELSRMFMPAHVLHDHADYILKRPTKWKSPAGFVRPELVDWRTSGVVTAVKNQGECGSCWSFATVATVESAHAIKKKQLYLLSEQEMIDCDPEQHGCKGGWPIKAMKFIKLHGLVEERRYPYKGKLAKECQLDKNRLGWTISEIKTPPAPTRHYPTGPPSTRRFSTTTDPVPTTTDEKIRIYIDDHVVLDDEEKIADWVATNGPVAFVMKVSTELSHYRSGVYRPNETECESSTQAHAMTIVGYGTEGNGSDYWLVRNSWGPRWGMGGYLKLARGYNVCGMANRAVGPIIK